jgi:hypothetical protein
MSEHFPISPNENDKNVLAPLDGQIAVMRLSNQFDEDGRQIAYKLDEEGNTATTIAGMPEAYSDKVQAHYAHKLAMDRNPTPEQMERGTPPKIITDLGSAALETTIAAPISAEAAVNSGVVEQELSRTPDLNVALVEGEVGTLKYANENFRGLPEAQRRHNLNAHITNKAHAAYDQFKAGKISEESYTVITNALLGAASSHDSIGAIVGMLRNVRTHDRDEVADVSSQAGAISEIASLPGLEGERARISFANSLIAKSERLLDDNDGVATSRYKAMVGFIAGLSTQINDPSTSSGFVSGALEQLRKHS